MVDGLLTAAAGSFHWWVSEGGRGREGERERGRECVYECNRERERPTYVQIHTPLKRMPFPTPQFGR